MGSAALGLRIRELRLKRGWRLADVADTADISLSYLSDIERGRTTPSLGTLHEIARSLGISVVDLLQSVPPYGTEKE